ncbi:Zn-dependent exopeptidase [Trichocladium antarcticum]|uniref:Zn-dependent exopeptidase n=1 Tax=Trichocladium antarcticum TaxID=1450529 RepID=A0AAN6UE10_9PEZI|nr:Zn-dependent exopeptidase [Trichocladium antarcticum]
MRPTTYQLLLLCSSLWHHGAALSVPDGQQQPLVHPSVPPNRNDADDAHDAHDAHDPPSYRAELLNLHKQLVDVPSISGSEGPVAALLDQILRSHGYTVKLQCLAQQPQDGQPPRCNVVAWPGPNTNGSLDNHVLVTSHIDVVPPYIPYRLNGTAVGHIDMRAITPDTRITGRGTVDAKASVAAQIIATSGEGMKSFSTSLSNTTTNPRPRLRAAIFGEPTDNRLACGHKGIATVTLRAAGRAGHSGYPARGVSATALLVRALGRILDADLGRSARFGNTTVNVGWVGGGVAANVIAAQASARAAIRVAVGDVRTGAGMVEGRLREVLAGVEVGEGGLELVMEAGYGPVECKCDVDGFDTMVANYGTDVPNLEGDHVSYLYGPGSILVAHGDDEGLRVRDLEDAVEGYKKLIKHALEG